MKLLCVILFNLCILNSAWAAPAKNLDVYWQPFAATESIAVDHQPWQLLLDNYLSIDAQQQTFFAYAKVTVQHRQVLNNYIASLSALDPLALTRAQQKAYWINLYNAATVNLILEKYPVKTITKLGKGFFSFGPWDDKLLSVNGRKLTLNDIEHRILRPIYNDERIHYAVNCASYSCPNLATKVYTKDNTHALLEQGAKQYINHSRGVAFSKNKLTLSSIFDWYQVDFGRNDTEVIKHLQKYAQPKLSAALTAYVQQGKSKIKYHYNWQLNEQK
ncbi:MAG: DUF547 domain-containing protein [Oceanospirillaceae bacterium]|nr:DUF547 domain-containing protein [Oceanospirillaceae bacterium]